MSETVERLREYAANQLAPDDRATRLWSALDALGIEENWGCTLKQPQWVLDAHNVQKGRIFIMGTGPSLATQKAILPRLAREQTWSVNRMSMFADALGFTPTHHSITEPGPIVDWGKGLAAGIDREFRRHSVSPFDFPKVANRIAIHWFPTEIPGWLWCAKAPDDVQIRWQGFQGLGNTLPPLPTGWASPLTSCQLAAWLGFTEFYFLGMDLTQGGQAWDTQRGGTRLPRSIVSILECADRAKVEIEKAGRRIVDCTPGGRANVEGVWPYVPLEEVLETVVEDKR